MQRTISNVAAGAIVLALSPAVHAHEGHGDPALLHTVWHYLVEPAHLPVTLGVLALAAVIVARRVLTQRKLREH